MITVTNIETTTPTTPSTVTTATTAATVTVVGKVGMECLYIRDGCHESITLRFSQTLFSFENVFLENLSQTLYTLLHHTITSKFVKTTPLLAVLQSPLLYMICCYSVSVCDEALSLLIYVTLTHMKRTLHNHKRPLSWISTIVENWQDWLKTVSKKLNKLEKSCVCGNHACCRSLSDVFLRVLLLIFITP